MNKRCIVNVSTGDFYCKMQDRLIYSFFDKTDVLITISNWGESTTKEFGRPLNKGIDLIVWKDCIPIGSRKHSESPYGFKVHAIKAAYDNGYTSILWLDSPAYAVKEDISPIFDKIEKEGYYVMSHIDPLINYVDDKLLHLNHLTVEDIKDKNLPSGTCYGFDLSNESIKRLFDVFHTDEMTGYFNRSAPHRHDETILALLMIRAKLPVFTFDPLFQSDSDECVIKSGG